jgi:hypothetical protein
VFAASEFDLPIRGRRLDDMVIIAVFRKKLLREFVLSSFVMGAEL